MKRKNKFYVLPVKHQCEKCHHKERYTILGYAAIVLLQFLATLGIVFAALLVVAGPEFIASFYVNFKALDYANDYSLELRQIALNSTTFSGDSPYDTAIDIALHFPNETLRYSYPSLFRQIQPPLETYLYGGDCKNTAILFTALMLNVGQKSEISCSSEYSHCVSFVSGKGRYSETYMVVDVASELIMTFNNTVDFWDWFGGKNGAKPNWVLMNWDDGREYRSVRQVAVVENGLQVDI